MMIYRVEHNEVIDSRSGWAVGPYCVASIGNEMDPGTREALAEMSDELCSDHCDSSHPLPSSDFRLDPRDRVVGMPALDSLMRWFEGWWGELHYQGFVVGVYETDTFDFETGGQVVFAPMNANLVAVLPMG